jgi:RND family efflux transporter MFP subunit
MKRLYLLILVSAFLPASAFADEQPSVLVTTQDIHQGSLPSLITAYGTVEALPDGATSISLLRAGQVDKLLVSPGQKVKQGDGLLDFISDPSALLAYDQAFSALDAAQKEQTRIQQLLKQRLATQSQLAQADKAASDAEAALEVEKKQGSDLKTETITAPFDGTVTNINISSGERVQSNAPLMQVAHGSGLAVGLGLALDDRANIETGETVHLEALDADKPALDGNVAFVANMLDPKMRLVKVLVTLPSAAASNLIPGEQFRAVIETGKLSGIIVPRQAVLKDGKGPYIYQAAGNKAERIHVRIVGESGDSYVIDGSIDTHKKIITTGNYELRDGSLIREGAATTDNTP